MVRGPSWGHGGYQSGGQGGKKWKWRLRVVRGVEVLTWRVRGRKGGLAIVEMYGDVRG